MIPISGSSPGPTTPLLVLEFNQIRSLEPSLLSAGYRARRPTLYPVDSSLLLCRYSLGDWRTATVAPSQKLRGTCNSNPLVQCADKSLKKREPPKMADLGLTMYSI